MNSVTNSFLYLSEGMGKCYTRFKRIFTPLNAFFSPEKIGNFLYRFKEREVLCLSFLSMGMMVQEYFQCVLEEKNNSLFGGKNWVIAGLYTLGIAQLFFRGVSQSSTTPYTAEEWNRIQEYLTLQGDDEVLRRCVNVIGLPALLYNLADTKATVIAAECLSFHLAIKLGSLLMALSDKLIYPRAFLFLSETSRKNKEIALILTATDDWNGALESTTSLICLNQLAQEFFLQEKKISCFQELRQAVKETARLGPIRILMINAHGSPASITLDETHFLTGEEACLPSVLKRLHPNAMVVLRSCSTGKKWIASSLAEKIALRAGNRTVFAPADTFSLMTFEKKGKCLRPRFYDVKVCVQLKFFFMSFFYRRDVTAPPFSNFSFSQ